jgi:hypothetical protein
MVFLNQCQNLLSRGAGLIQAAEDLCEGKEYNEASRRILEFSRDAGKILEHQETSEESKTLLESLVHMNEELYSLHDKIVRKKVDEIFKSNTINQKN